MNHPTTAKNAVPEHQRPTSCHVCGEPEAYQPDRCTACSQYAEPCGAHRPDCPHDLTNAEADAAAREHDRRVSVRYSSGATSPESEYVASTRGL